MTIDELMIQIGNILRGVDNQQISVGEAFKAIRTLIETFEE